MKQSRKLATELSALFMVMVGGFGGGLLASIVAPAGTKPAMAARIVLVFAVIMPFMVSGMLLGIALWVLLLRSRVTLEEMVGVMRSSNYPIIPVVLESIVRRVYYVGHRTSPPTPRSK